MGKPAFPSKKLESSFTKDPFSLKAAKKKTSKNPNKPEPSKKNLPVDTPLTSKLYKSSKKVNLRVLEQALPKLNTITPAGVQKPKGKKKGKTFVDDPKTMMNILAVVAQGVEGKERSKIEKERQLEIIREAKREEMEKKDNARKAKLDAAKKQVRGKEREKKKASQATKAQSNKSDDKSVKKEDKSPRKKVSFA
ncbi:hypothetical protein BJ508DRAFT_413226 [Ascobolus immersus RN42]|uniref:60S ribosomal subunit assembly/export protein loc1 n=1 Tax=Ascobolus immersus RN42 TaxID=1160509 RepID=A0A3N4IGT9_ASCIM|nr:hypothetical protein BJ508DRAFT_413226 [Ascobolus immersus RN42]